MRYSGIQPQYFPRLHYFARILAADVFMVRDDVQFVIKHKYPDGGVDKSYQAHTPIKHSFGRHLLAVATKHSGLPKLFETKLSYDNGWVESHLKALRFAYSKTANFNKLYKEIEELLARDYESLTELNLATILWGVSKLISEDKINQKDLTIENVQRALGEQKKFRLRTIRLGTNTGAYKSFEKLGPNEKIVALIGEVGADEDYCGGTSVAAYVDHDIFEKNGIKITVQDWKCGQYAQQFSKYGFIPNLSIIDLLMNVDRGEAAKIISG